VAGALEDTEHARSQGLFSKESTAVIRSRHEHFWASLIEEVELMEDSKSKVWRMFIHK
jgi:hypothetical protein